MKKRNIIIIIAVILLSLSLVQSYNSEDNYNCVARKLKVHGKTKIDNYGDPFHNKYCLVLVNEETNQLYQVIVPRNTYQFSIIGESIIVLECKTLNYSQSPRVDPQNTSHIDHL